MSIETERPIIKEGLLKYLGQQVILRSSDGLIHQVKLLEVNPGWVKVKLLAKWQISEEINLEVGTIIRAADDEIIAGEATRYKAPGKSDKPPTWNWSGQGDGKTRGL